MISTSAGYSNIMFGTGLIKLASRMYFNLCSCYSSQLAIIRIPCIELNAKIATLYRCCITRDYYIISQIIDRDIERAVDSLQFQTRRYRQCHFIITELECRFRLRKCNVHRILLTRFYGIRAIPVRLRT